MYPLQIPPSNLAKGSPPPSLGIEDKNKSAGGPGYLRAQTEGMGTHSKNAGQSPKTEMPKTISFQWDDSIGKVLDIIA